VNEAGLVGDFLQRRGRPSAEFTQFVDRSRLNIIHNLGL
jgi:hypothetical protein